MSQDPISSIGRARTVLVFGAGDAATASVSTVVARVRRDSRRRRLQFTGTVVYEHKLATHLGQTVLPAVDRVVERLLRNRRQTAKPTRFEVSMVNLGAASATDVGLSISGYSVDIPVFLALLSAVLRMPLPQDVVTTGHIASPDGDVRPVRNIPAKLAAAADDPSISRFLCPAPDADTSLQGLAPAERERIKAAIIDFGGSVQVATVGDVAQVIRQVAPEASVVLSSLARGYFRGETEAESNATPIEHAVTFLAVGNDARFWRVLEGQLLSSNGEAARDLLLARCRYHVRQRKYPKGFGLRLFQLVQSLPRLTRRNKTLFPLLPRNACLRLCRFGRGIDYEDVRHLMDAVVGEVAGIPAPRAAAVDETATVADEQSAAVEGVLAEIDAETLAREIGLPIDSARASYVMGDVLIDSADEFNDTVASFYLALLRHSHPEPILANAQELADEAFDLLERAFSDRGGVNAARAEARDGIHGGMRHVLDAMTEQYKIRQQSKHVDRVLQEALDPLNWTERVEFMRAFLDRLGPQLPAEIRDQPPERFARHYGEILHAYVRSLDRFKQLLGRL